MDPKSKPMAFDDVVETEVEAPEAPEQEMEQETATLSMEMLGGKSVKPGDVVSLEVVDVSDEDGTLTVKYRNPKNGGISKAAAAFNEGP